MVSSRTLNIKKKRELLKDIATGFLLLADKTKVSDNKIGRLPLIQLQNSKIDVENFIKWSRASERESLEPSMCANDGDGMERIAQNKVYFTSKNEVKKEC